MKESLNRLLSFVGRTSRSARVLLDPLGARPGGRARTKRSAPPLREWGKSNQ